ncbi:hypothetical protein PSAE105876_29140 [Pseudomonas aeruginosa]
MPVRKLGLAQPSHDAPQRIQSVLIRIHLKIVAAS